MANKAQAQIDQFFRKLNGFVDKDVPAIIRQSGVEYFKGSFTRKAFDGVAWAPHSKKYKPKGGSLMVKSSKLLNSISGTIKPDRVTFNGGNSRTPYARIHNEGGTINRAARSELFIRNRYTKGAKSKAFGGMGLYKKGTTAGKGLTFKAYTVNMPQRQYMGYAKELNVIIMERIKVKFQIK